MKIEIFTCVYWPRHTPTLNCHWSIHLIKTRLRYLIWTVLKQSLLINQPLNSIKSVPTNNITSSSQEIKVFHLSHLLNASKAMIMKSACKISSTQSKKVNSSSLKLRVSLSNHVTSV